MILAHSLTEIIVSLICVFEIITAPQVLREVKRPELLASLREHLASVREHLASVSEHLASVREKLASFRPMH
jgi:hypothetical protein